MQRVTSSRPGRAGTSSSAYNFSPSGDVAGDGPDEIKGGIGPDFLIGDNFSALGLAADGGDDALRGEEGNDDLDGGPARDICEGGRGNDDLDRGPARDFCEGGAGNADTATDSETEVGIPQAGLPDYATIRARGRLVELVFESVHLFEHHSAFLSDQLEPSQTARTSPAPTRAQRSATVVVHVVAGLKSRRAPLVNLA